MGNLRTKEGRELYDKAIAAGLLKGRCVLCGKKGIKYFMYWKVVKNDFPYDRIADRHDMLVPLRHTGQDNLFQEEKEELLGIKNGYIRDTYEWILETTQTRQSIPEHFHLHLVVVKD